MIRWLWSRMMKWGWDFSYQPAEEYGRKPIGRIRNRIEEAVLAFDSASGIDLHDPITFRVQAVTGGTVVETRWYDHKKDENRVKLHIVTQEENLADSIGKIVTMELLQK